MKCMLLSDRTLQYGWETLFAKKNWRKQFQNYRQVAQSTSKRFQTNFRFALQVHLTIILKQNRSHLRLWLVFVVPQRPSLTQEGTAFQIIFSKLATNWHKNFNFSLNFVEMKYKMFYFFYNEMNYFQLNFNQNLQRRKFHRMHFVICADSTPTHCVWEGN